LGAQPIWMGSAAVALTAITTITAAVALTLFVLAALAHLALAAAITTALAALWGQFGLLLVGEAVKEGSHGRLDGFKSSELSRLHGNAVLHHHRHVRTFGSFASGWLGRAQAFDSCREGRCGCQSVGLEGVKQRLLFGGHVDGVAEADQGEFNAFGAALKADHAAGTALATLALAIMLAQLGHIALALSLFLSCRSSGGVLGEGWRDGREANSGCQQGNEGSGLESIHNEVFLCMGSGTLSGVKGT
jgi:hypothetical protein